MASVTQRIKEVQQPKGGYIPVKWLNVIDFDDEYELEEENIHASIVGLAVDYLTRYAWTQNAEDAFKVSLIGAGLVGEKEKAYDLLEQIKRYDDDSVIAACQLAGYDVLARAGMKYFKPVEQLIPNDSTIRNIKIMVNRSLTFLEEYGPIIKDGFTFEGGYTKTVSQGDGDFLTEDTLWDFKVSKDEPKKEHTLQLLMYYLLGLNSIHSEFQNIKKLGIFNPRLNKVYTINICEIPPEIISEVSEVVIGYGGPKDNTVKKKEESTLPYISAMEVAEILGGSKNQVYRLIHMGVLPAEKRGNKYLIHLQDVEDYLEKLRIRRIWSAIIVLTTLGMCLLFLIWMILSFF